MDKNNNQVRNIYLIIGLIAIAAGIIFSVIWVISDLDLGIMIIGAVVFFGPGTVFIYMYFMSKNQINLQANGIDGMAVLTKVKVALGFMFLFYTYTDQNGVKHEKEESPDSIKKRDISVVETLKEIPIRYHGRISKIREAELFRIVQDIKAENLEHAAAAEKTDLTKPLVSNICPNCAGKINFESSQKGVCVYCDTQFMR